MRATTTGICEASGLVADVPRRFCLPHVLLAPWHACVRFSTTKPADWHSLVLKPGRALPGNMEGRAGWHRCCKASTFVIAAHCQPSGAAGACSVQRAWYAADLGLDRHHALVVDRRRYHLLQRQFTMPLPR